MNDEFINSGGDDGNTAIPDTDGIDTQALENTVETASENVPESAFEDIADTQPDEPYEPSNEESETDDENIEKDVLIQELSDLDEHDGEASDDESEDEVEKHYCIRCENEVPEFVELCEDCEKKIKKYPLSVGSFFLAAIVIVIAVFGAMLFSINMPIVLSVFSGDKALRDNRLEDCYDAYNEAYSFVENYNTIASLSEDYTIFSIGNNTLAKQFIALYKLNGPYSCGQYIDRYFGDNVPSSLKSIAAEYNDIVSVSEAMDGKFTSYYEALGENGKADINELLEIIDTVEAENDFPPYLVTYYRFLAASSAEANVSVRCEYMDKLISEKPDALWLYGSYAIALYKENGDLVKALDICNRLIQKNPTDASAIAYSMSVLRMDNKFDDAMTLYNSALKSIETTPELERQKAIILMLQGKAKDAMTVLEESYSLETLTVQYAETICACCIMTNDTAKYEETCNLLAGYGITVSEKIQQLNAGKISAEDIYMKGTGETV